MTNIYIRLISLLPRINKEAVEDIEETAAWLAVHVSENIKKNSQTIAGSNRK